jgi:hypothetical protein
MAVFNPNRRSSYYSYNTASSIGTDVELETLAITGDVVSHPVEPKVMWEILIPSEKRVKSPEPVRSREPVDEKNETFRISARSSNLRAWEQWYKQNSYSIEYHNVWDAFVREATDGLTIVLPTRKQRASSGGELFSEKMIPVRIMATRAEIERIIDYTLGYYDQGAVLCYLVSTEVILRHRG